MSESVGAPLEFRIDSSQAVSATEALDRMVRRSADASTAVRTLGESSVESTRALRDMAQQGLLLESALKQVGTGIDGLVGRVQVLSRELSIFQATSRDMQTALGQLRAAADLFGTTAAGLDAYVRASRSIGQTSYETVQGLQRIQQALEGNTLAAERARSVLRNYGIELEGMSRDSAADVQRRFVAAWRATGRDARSNDDMATVLGPQSITSMAAINSERYLDEDQRRRRLEEGVQAGTVLRTQIATAERVQRTENRRAESEDLWREYRNYWDWNVNRPSDDQLRARRDAGAQPRSQAMTWTPNADGTATFNWDQRWGERLANTFMPPGIGGPGYFQGIGGAIGARLTNDQFDANRRSILAQYDERVTDAAQLPFFPRLGARISAGNEYLMDLSRNVLGLYAPPMVTQDKAVTNRTASYDADTRNWSFTAGMAAPQQQLQQQIINAVREMLPSMDASMLQRQTPAEIMASLPMRERSSIQARFDAQDRVLGLQNDRARADQTLMRRASLGGLQSQDMFGLRPEELGLTEDPTTNQEAAERARTIGQAILRIRNTVKGELAQAAELNKVVQELDADQATRRDQRNNQAQASLDFTRRTAGLVTDVNPANRARNAADLAFARALEDDPNNQQGAMIAGQRALTEAVISLERVMNEAVRQSQIGLAGAIGGFNAYVGDAPIPRVPGMVMPEGGIGAVFAPSARVERLSAVTSEAGSIEASARRYASVPGRPPVGATYREPSWARGLRPANGQFWQGGGGSLERLAANDVAELAPTVVTAPPPPSAESYVDIPGLLTWTPARSAAEVYRRQGNRTLEASAVGQSNRMNMPAGVDRDEFEANAIAQGAVEALTRMARSFDEATAAHQNNIEALRASTSAERELIVARQQAERQEAMLRGLAREARDPAIRQQLEGLAGLQVPTALSRTRETQAGQFDANLRMQRLNLEDAEAENDNWYMTNAERARLRGERAARRGARDRGFGDDSPQSREAVSLAGRTSEMQELARQNQLVRDSFLEVGNASANALNQIILRGGNARQVMQALLADLASMAFRRATLGLAEKAFSLVGGLFAASTGPGGAAGGVLAGGVADSAGNLMPFAQGGIAHRFTRGFASGAVLDHPTYFPLSDGNTGLAAEAGRPEAVLPLKRDANGNLGVAASGGGGGGTVVNVTVNNSGGQGTSPDQAKNIAKLVSQAVDEANQKNLREQMRIGGSLNPIYGAA